MSKEPAQRHQTADELTAALDSVLSVAEESLTFEAPWQQLSSPFGIVTPTGLPEAHKGDGRRVRALERDSGFDVFSGPYGGSGSDTKPTEFFTTKLSSHDPASTATTCAAGAR